MSSSDLTLDGLVGCLTAFELSNFDNNVPIIGNAFKSLLTIISSKKEKSSKDESDSNSKNDIDEIEEFLARRLLRGKGKFKGKLILIYF